MNYPIDFNAFELPLNKINAKQDLKAWKNEKITIGMPLI